MNRHYAYLNKPIHRQKGVSLTVVLILLLIMTLLGLASMRGALLQERMSSNEYDRSLGFQASEAALRQAETVVSTNPVIPAAATCTAGLCPQPVAGTTDRWDLSQTTVNWATVAGDTLTTPSIPPSRYIVEDMGMHDILNPLTTGLIGSQTRTPQYHMYRITAESQGAGRSRVLLQSNYSTP
jgi:type IV pilus assembly protein PilX